MNGNNCQPDTNCCTANVLTIYNGDDVVSQIIQVLMNAQPVDLTGATEIEIDFSNNPPTTPANYAAKLSTNQISISSPVNPVLGHLALSLASADTALFQPVTLADLDVIVTNASGKKQTYRITQGLTVRSRTN